MTDPTEHILIPVPALVGDIANLTDALDQAVGQPVEIDLGALRSVTAVHLQILLSADQEWQSANAGFRVTNISEDCRRSLALLGLEPTQWRNEGV